MTSDIENRPYGSTSATGSREDPPGDGGSFGRSQSGFGQTASGGEERRDLSKAAGDEANAVRSAVGREAGSAREELGSAKENVKQGLSSLGETAREKAAEGVEKGKSELASGLGDFAAAIRKASNELGERDRSMAAGLVREVANGLEQATGAISGSSVQDLTRSVADFARRQPTTFLIGAALAGIALGRFARASGETVHPGTGSGRSEGWRETGFDRDAHGFGTGREPASSGDRDLAPGRNAPSRPVSAPVSGGTPASRPATASGSTHGTEGLSPSSVDGRNAPPPAGPVPPEGPSGAVLGHGSGSFNPQGGRDVR